MDASSSERVERDVLEPMSADLACGGTTGLGVAARTATGVCACDWRGGLRSGELSRELEMSASEPRAGALQRELARECRGKGLYADVGGLGCSRFVRHGLRWGGRRKLGPECWWSGLRGGGINDSGDRERWAGMPICGQLWRYAGGT